MDENIEKWMKRIAGIINDPRKQYELLNRRKDWSKLCTCIDTIEDTETAIDYYLNLPNFDAYKGGYLFTYGVLQALFLQQDAVANLYDGIFGTQEHIKDMLDNNPKLKQIREIRNNSIGHPTNRGGKSFHRIVQHSICKNGFQLYSDNEGTNIFNDIKIIKIINTQREVVADNLKLIVQVLEEELATHKNLFKDEKLQRLFNHRRYCVEKISDCIYVDNSNNGKEKFAFSQLAIIQQNYNEFIDNIIKRYSHILDCIQYIQPKIECVFQELMGFSNTFGLYKNTKASVLIDALNLYLEGLESISEEIDSEYSN